MNNPKKFRVTFKGILNTFFSYQQTVYIIKFLTLYFINRLLKRCNRWLIINNSFRF